MSSRSKVLLLSALAVAALWVADAAVEALIFSLGSFSDRLVMSLTEHEMLMRLTASACVLGLGTLVAWQVGRRERAERRLLRLNAVLRAIRNVNQLIAREHDRDRLIQQACEQLIDTRGYHNAWIALADASGGFLTAAAAGLGDDFKAMIEHLETGRMPDCWRRAMDQDDVLAVDSPAAECTDCPLSHRYAGRSGMSIRLRYGQRVHGVLTVSVPEGLNRDAEEQTLLRDLAEDLSLALNNIEAERALSESRAWFATTLASIGDAVLAVDLEGKVTFANPVARALIGWSDGALGKPLADVFRIVNTVTRKPAEDPVTRVLREGKVAGLANHTTLISRDGQEHQIADSAAPIRREDGQAIGVVLVFRDITEQYHQQEALRKSHDYLDRILNGMYEAVMVVDRDYVIRDVNACFLRQYGLAREDVIGRHCHEVTHRTSQPCAKLTDGCPLVTVFSTGKPAEAEHVHFARDGKPRTVEIHAFPLLDENGQVELMVELARDVTERKEADDALRASEARYRRLFDKMPSGVAHCRIVLDRDGKPVDFVYLAVNDAFEKLTGLTRDAVIGRKVTEAIPGIREAHPELFDIYGQAALAGTEKTFEINFRPLGIYLSVTAYSPARGEFVAVFENVTERKRAEEEREAYQKRLQELASELSSAEERERRRLAEDLHDRIGQNLAATRMHLQIVPKTALSESQADALGQSLSLLKEMSKDIRTLTFELCPPVLYDMGLSAAIAWLLEQFRRQHPIAFRLEDDEGDEPMSDEVRGFVYRAVRELLLNAIAHAHAGTVAVRLGRTGDQLTASVEDDGVGFDAADVGSAGQAGGGFGLVQYPRAAGGPRRAPGDRIRGGSRKPCDSGRAARDGGSIGFHSTYPKRVAGASGQAPFGPRGRWGNHTSVLRICEARIANKRSDASVGSRDKNSEGLAAGETRSSTRERLWPARHPTPG